MPAFALFLAAERRITARDGEPLVNVQVLARPAICWALLTLLVATGTYYALLFTLAQYLQQGLGDSPLASGLALVPWVAAFGLAGQLVRRLPPRMASRTPAAGCLLLAAAYLAISIMLFAGHHVQALLVVLLGVGGLGLGIQFSALIRHLTTAAPAGYAADISGVSTTALQVGAATGVAAFGTLYLSLASRGGAGLATHAFAITTAAFAFVALLAAVTAALATWQAPGQREHATAAPGPSPAKPRTPGRHETTSAPAPAGAGNQPRTRDQLRSG